MRTQRKESTADIYHVVSRGVGRQNIFENDSDRNVFLENLVSASKKEDVELYAWCLMSNHVHLILHAPLFRVSECMKTVLGKYAQYFNAKTGRSGHLFQERFKSEPINTDEYLLMAIRYIHANPEKAGLALTEEYKWSSYHEYMEQPGICSIDYCLTVFDGKDAFAAHWAREYTLSCLDLNEHILSKYALPDDFAIKDAEKIAGVRLNSLKEMKINERNSALALLKKSGFSVRQLERLTGIGRGIISRI